MDLSEHQAMSAYTNPGVSQGDRYRISIAIDVVNTRALWNAALSRGLMAPGATFEDVVDTIGPCDDPAIADCLAMLALPADLKGCLVDDFTIDPALPRGVMEASRPWTGASAAR